MKRSKHGKSSSWKQLFCFHDYSSKHQFNIPVGKNGLIPYKLQKVCSRCGRCKNMELSRLRGSDIQEIREHLYNIEIENQRFTITPNKFYDN